MNKVDTKKAPGLLALALLAAVAALALSACQRDSRTAGEQVDSAVAKMEQGAEKAKQTMREGAADMKAGAEAAADKTANAVGNATTKANDALITTGVNAELAKDAQLSALKINVDTTEGRVVLNGTAPDETSRLRATQLAANVKGVMSVDNKLQVR